MTAHRIPVRLSLVVLAVVVSLLGPSAGSSDTVLLALLGVVGTAIAGDSYRPSGQVR